MDKNTQRPAGGFGRGGPGAQMFGAPGAKAKDFKGALKKLFAYLKPHVVPVLAVVVFAIASTIFTIVGPKILGNVTNQLVDDYISIKVYDEFIKQLPAGTTFPAGTTGEIVIAKLTKSQIDKIPSDQIEKIKALDLSRRPEYHFDSMAQTAVLLLVLYILSAIFNYIQGWIMAGVSQKVTFELRSNVSQKLKTLPLRYFDKNPHGDILSRITNDIDTIGQSLNQSLSQMITSVTSIIGIAVMMFSISWELTIVAILVIPLSFVFIALIVKKSQPHFSSQAASLGEINAHVEEMYGGHNVIKAFNGEKASLEKFGVINSKLYESGWKSQFLSGLLMPVMSFIGNLGYVAIAVLGGWFAIQGKIKIGDIQAFIQYVQQFTQPIIQAANTTTVLQSTAAAAERVFELLEEPEEVKESTDVLEKGEGHVVFDSISFGYEIDKQIIKNFSAEAKPGQRVAIVGPTGAGKTTIVNLLMRFYDVDSGSILIDGKDIRSLKRSSLRTMFGMVLQDTWLFNGTLRENIAYGKPDATEEEIIQAAKAAQVDHFIHSLPNGYDMVLNEATDNISQGEKQLLTIARAMLANPPMLILDEATSSVDTRTEILIQNAMEALMHGRTSFVIAHRLSTIKNADLILVMNQGQIVEQGTHDELLAKNGFYADLYNSQFPE